jgi:uncharacterized protein YuzE
VNDKKLKYDPQVDILDIRLSDSPIEESDEIEPGVIVDYDANGNIVGIEILDASERVKRTQATAEQM